MLILSICIPSYNRFRVIQKNLNSILESNSKQFEVIVVDNCSPEDIYQGLDISDSRVKIIRRKEPVYGPRNVSECLSYAKGKYALLCLDKDQVNGRYLEQFINCLQKNPNICGGYCGQDWGKGVIDTEPLIYTDNTLREFGYLSKHPSGDFYRMSCINKWFQDLSNPLLDDPFFFDILLAECASCGAMLKFQKAMITVESPEECLKIKSISISPEKGNLFFAPQNRIEQFKVFCKHLEQLRCNQKDKYKTLYDLYKRTLLYVTSAFKECMNNRNICIHYKITSRKVSFKELIYWWWVFNWYFLCTNICQVPLYKRIHIIVGVHINAIRKKFRKYLHKML